MTRTSMCAALALCCMAGTALAQKPPADYPGKPVTIIVAFPPGGPVDLEYRVFANKIIANTGRSILVDYKPGAGGLLGTAYVAKAPPDGYTILGTTNSYTTLPALHKDMPYDALKDLTPVSLLAKRPSLLIVHASLPINSLAEYVAYAQANPGKINFGTPGLAGGPHLASEWLHSVLNTKVTYVHYKGAAPMGVDLLAGRVNASLSVPVAVMAQVKAGKLRALATSSAERTAVFPDLKTVIEQGGKGYDYAVWTGVFAPGATPAPIVSWLNTEFIKALKSPDIATKIEAEGNIFVGSTPQRLREIVVSEIAQFGKIVRESNIQSPPD
jgi:tripartite-type tricarboxylate transporter receptor subunit TctC